MKLRSILTLLAGSFVVHLAVACGSQAIESASGGNDSGVADAILDVIADVPNAEAAPGGDSGPTVTTISCDKFNTIGGAKIYYAEQLFPGRTMVQLSNVKVLICRTDAGAAAVGWPPGYNCTSGGGLVRDGAVAVICGNDVSPIATIQVIDG